MEIIEAILIIILLTIWLVFSVVFLSTAIQNFINDRKREADKDKRDLEYHKAHMKKYSHLQDYENEVTING